MTDVTVLPEKSVSRAAIRMARSRASAGATSAVDDRGLRPAKSKAFIPGLAISRR